MSDQTSNQIVDRLLALEERWEQIELRVRRVEQRLNMSPEQPVTQSIAPALPRVPIVPPPHIRPSGATAAPQAGITRPVSSPKMKADDLEYKIGLTGLLRGGAAVVVLALVYLVGLAISRGYITPSVQFVGEIGLCLGFMVFGQIKRFEREEFGQLMIGIGSCGLFLSAAGGDLAKHLYSDETMVGMFVALSLLNLAYSWAKSTRSFLTIGMLGGFSASMMPMKVHNQTMDLVLHLLILVPSLAVILRNQWNGMAAAAYGFSIFSLIPMVGFAEHGELRIATLAITSTLCAWGYARTWKGSTFDPICAFSVVPVSIAALWMLTVHHVGHHTPIILGLSLLVGTSAFAIPKDTGNRGALWMASAVTACLISPMGLIPFQASLAYSAIAIGLALVAIRFDQLKAVYLSASALSFSIIAYLQPWNLPDFKYTLSQESGMLLMMMGATIAAAVVVHRKTSNLVPVPIFGGLLVLAMFERLGAIRLYAIENPYAHQVANIAPAYCLALAILGISYSYPSLKLLRIVAVLALGWSALCYVGLVLDSSVLWWFDSGLIVSLMVAFGLVLSGGIRSGGSSERAFSINLYGTVFSLLIYRLVFVLVEAPALRHVLGDADSILISGMIVALLATVGSRRFILHSTLVQGWLSIGLAGLAGSYLRESSITSYPAVIGLQLTYFIVLALLTQATWRFVKVRSMSLGTSTLLAWLVVSQMSEFITHLPHVGLQSQAAMSLAWTVLALGLMTSGFRFRVSILRYWGLGVFGTTLVKVFAFDLSNLDPGVRVAILLVLGLGMIGAGYWYIRTKGSVDVPDDQNLA